MNKKVICAVGVMVILILISTVLLLAGRPETSTPTESESVATVEKTSTDTEMTDSEVETVLGVEIWEDETVAATQSQTEEHPSNQGTTTSTQPTTNPTTAPTTEPTTVPTTESTTAPSTEPTEKPKFSAKAEEYERYMKLSPEQQQVYFEENFDSMEEFLSWYNEAKTAYEAAQEWTDVEGEPGVNLEEIIGGNS